MKYRKRPVVIDAFRWTVDRVPDWWTEFAKEQRVNIITSTGEAIIPTLEGNMRASIGDWIIRGVKKEIYPCKPDIFEATYEPVNE